MNYVDCNANGDLTEKDERFRLSKSRPYVDDYEERQVHGITTRDGRLRPTDVQIRELRSVAKSNAAHNVFMVTPADRQILHRRSLFVVRCSLFVDR